MKSQRSKGRGLLPGLRAGDDGAPEAAFVLSRAWEKQHAKSVMGPPVKPEGYVFHYFGYFITLPLQAERLRSPAGEGREYLGRKDWDG